MKCKKLLALSGALLVAAVMPAANAVAADGAKVTVRVEGKTKTLLNSAVVQTRSGWITKGGAPSGKCSAASAQGALDVATRHSWSGSFSNSLGSYFIKTILGETDNGPSIYWSIYVNNKSAATGACGIKLHPGDQLLFAAAPYPAYPIALSGPSSATSGRSFNVTAVWYTSAGKAKPLAGAKVSGSGVSGVTNSKGIAHLTASHAGTLQLRASKKGYIRPAVLRVKVS